MNGACIIEKHFTLDNDLPGPDHWFSVNPSNLKMLVDDVKYAYTPRGLGFANDRMILNKKCYEATNHILKIEYWSYTYYR